MIDENDEEQVRSWLDQGRCWHCSDDRQKVHRWDCGFNSLGGRVYIIFFRGGVLAGAPQHPPATGNRGVEE